MSQSMSAIVGNRVKQLRLAKRWSVRALVERCAAAGFTVTAGVIEDIEGRKGRSQDARPRRAVSVDEVLAFALVLNVSPLSLMTPRSDLDTCRVTSTTTVEAGDLGRWIACQSSDVPGEPSSTRTADWVSQLPGWLATELYNERHSAAARGTQ